MTTTTAQKEDEEDDVDECNGNCFPSRLRISPPERNQDIINLLARVKTTYLQLQQQQQQSVSR